MKTKNIRLALAMPACAAAAYYLLPPEPAAATPRGGVPTVRLAPALRQDVAVEIEANGTVVPLSTVEIRSRVSRVLTRVHVKEGQYVVADALLFTLDDRGERAALDRARAQLARGQVALADLERQFSRSQELAARNFISPSAADLLRSQVEAQRAQLLADQATLRAAQAELSYTVLRAPAKGRVGAIDVYAGTLVQTNAALASVTQIDPIAVSFTVPESGLPGLLERIKSGPVAVSATLGGKPRTLDGKLSFIDSAVDPVAGTIRVKASFDNALTLLWPGQYVHARLTVGTLRDAVVVPLSAIVADPSGALVYTIGADQLAHPHPVTLLHAFGQRAAVSGLRGGERVIVEGRQNLDSGATVKLAQGGALADAGAPAGMERAR